jgi:hypothetical protein
MPMVPEDFVIIFSRLTWEGFVKQVIAASLLLVMLSACSNTVQPTSTASPTFTLSVAPTRSPTSIPTLTPLPPSETPDIVSELLPESQPASEWKGIPIMPGAIAGEGDEEGYVFTIRATPQQVQEYYQLELGQLGWQLYAQGDGESSTMLIFMNSASTTLTVSIIAKGETVLVLLVI